MIEPIFVQKAKPFLPEKHNVNGWGIQRKLDGVRIQIVINNMSDIRIFSRSIIEKTNYFNEYTDKLPHIVDEIRTLKLRNIILDGEAVVYKHQLDYDNCRLVSGILNSDAQKAFSKQITQSSPVHVVLFDIPLSKDNYLDRHTELEGIVNPNMQFIHVNPMWINDNDTSYEDIYENIVADGGEGIILYNLDAQYKHHEKHCAKSSDVLKIKGIDELEVIAESWVHGLPGTQFEDTVGKLICRDHRGCTFPVGSGLNAEWRAQILSGEIELPVIIEMLYNEETPDAYRLPRIFKIRTDKDVSDWTPC